MKEAIFEAECAYKNGEVPVGAVVVLGSEIIARGHNKTEASGDPTAHAEVVAIRAAAEALGNWRLLECTLYVTLEPCMMCAGAMFLARIPRLVWGAPDFRHGACGSFIDLFSKNHPIHTIDVERGLLADESAQLLRTFFQEQRDVKRNNRDARKAIARSGKGDCASSHS